jgi:predicted nucleic acid-binding protein
LIVVDTSVWVPHFRNEGGPAVESLRALGDPNDIVVGDLVLLECLQGARNEGHAALIEVTLQAFRIEAMLDAGLAVEAARHYRLLRAMGLTPRKTFDLIIGAFCIKNRYVLLHQDRDFDALAAHCGLQVF